MDCYSIQWRRATRKEIRKIPKTHVKRIVEAVNLLSENPRPDGCKKMHDSDRAYRIRVGNYRVIYEIFDEMILVEVVRVGHRKDVYK